MENEILKMNKMEGNHMPKILGIGINTMDIYRHEGRMYPGGNEFNIAYHAKKHGIDAAFMGVFSRTDSLSHILYRTLKDADVDLSHSRFEDGKSGFAVVDLKDGDRVFADWNRRGVTDLHPLVFTEEDMRYIRAFDMVCISRCSRLSNEKIRQLAENGTKICYDFCDNYTEEDIASLSPYIRIGFVSGSHMEEEDVKRTLKNIARAGADIAVATRGAKRTILFDGGEFLYQPCRKTAASDTMGAGDSFISTFLTTCLTEGGKTGYKKKEILVRALWEAAEYAAKIVTLRGSLGIGYDISQKEIEKLLGQLSQEVGL